MDTFSDIRFSEIPSLKIDFDKVKERQISCSDRPNPEFLRYIHFKPRFFSLIIHFDLSDLSNALQNLCIEA